MVTGEGKWEVVAFKPEPMTEEVVMLALRGQSVTVGAHEVMVMTSVL